MTTSITRAIEIGRECLAIESAIDQLVIGWRNRNLNDSKYDVYGTKLFKELSSRREALREELVEMN